MHPLRLLRLQALFLTGPQAAVGSAAPLHTADRLAVGGTSKGGLNAVKTVCSPALMPPEVPQHPRDLAHQCVDVRSLGQAFEPHDAHNKFVDGDHAVAVHVHVAKNLLRVEHIKFQRGKTRTNLFALGEVLEAVQADGPSLLFVELVKELLQPLHQGAVSFQFLLRQSFPIFGRGISGALHEDAHDDVEHAHHQHQDVQQEEAHKDW
mmetsp:Transcript_98215/g.227746  ORF Transcript_98215/g.227746 Transcript_98215/m.227746 type:complete len:207 (+) Transcript_98215:45-665(+)